MKIAAVILVVLVLGAGVFWFGWVRHPSQEDVCKHVTELVKKQGRRLTDARCMRKTKKGSLEGLLPYAKRMKCYKAGTTLKDILACDKK